MLKVLNEKAEISNGDIQAFDNFVANAHITILPSNYRISQLDDDLLVEQCFKKIP